MKKPKISLSELKRLNSSILKRWGTLLLIVLIFALTVPAVSAEDGALSASFTFSTTSLKAGSSVSFTNTSTGSNISGWAWDFGDGEEATTQNPTHTYKCAGSYLVKLTISSNDSTDTSTSEPKTVQISKQDKPEAAFTGTPISGVVPLTVGFSSITSKGYNITSWVWDFGDGSDPSTVKNPSHVYDTVGAYTVNLTVKNDAGDNLKTQSNYITVSPPASVKLPAALFKYSPSSPTMGNQVKFTDQSTGNPTTWSWKFGDGGVSNDQNPLYTYPDSGNYIINLTVSNVAGSVFKIQDISVVKADPLCAKFIWSPKTPKANASVSFTDESEGSPTSWTWDFGDETPSSDEQNPSHKYTKDGTYKVKLTVKKSGLSPAFTTETITVGDVTPTPIAGPKPKADFEWSPNPVVGIPINFKDTSTGEGITEWKWDFDDKMDFTSNRKSTIQNPQHTYQYSGTYDVTLFVKNSGGTDIILKKITVNPPKAATPTPAPTAFKTAKPTPTPTPEQIVAASIPDTPEDGGFIGGEYRMMTGLYNEYIRIIFGFLGISDGPNFLIFAVK